MAYAACQILAPGRPYGQSAEKSTRNEALSAFKVLLTTIKNIKSEIFWGGITFECIGQTIFKSMQEFSIGFPKKLILRLKMYIHGLRTACTFLGILGSVIVDE